MVFSIFFFHRFTDFHFQFLSEVTNMQKDGLGIVSKFDTAATSRVHKYSIRPSRQLITGLLWHLQSLSA